MIEKPEYPASLDFYAFVLSLDSEVSPGKQDLIDEMVRDSEFPRDACCLEQVLHYLDRFRISEAGRRAATSLWADYATYLRAHLRRRFRNLPARVAKAA